MSGKVIDVGMDEPEFASFPDAFHTHGVHTCIAVAYLNETTR